MKLILALLLLVPALGFADGNKKPITIGVIDTGFGRGSATSDDHLCKMGHKDFTPIQKFGIFETKDPVPTDNHGHGTNIVGVIEDNAKDSGVDYCIVVIKYFDPLEQKPNNLQHTIDAIKYATLIKLDIINYSGGGTDKSDDEVAAVKAYLDGGGTFIASAGNEHANIDVTPYYPAMDDKRVIRVGSKYKAQLDDTTDIKPDDDKIIDTVKQAGIVKVFFTKKTTTEYVFFKFLNFTDTSDENHSAYLVMDQGSLLVKPGYSNYGDSVQRWEVGTDVTAYDITMSGTSQAAAIATGKLLGEKFKKEEKEPETTDTK